MNRKLLGYYVLTTVVFTLVLMGLFATPLFSGQKILLFRGLWLLVVATGLTRLLVNWYKVSGETMLAAMIWAISLNLVFLVLFLVTLDRSITTYLLVTMSNGNYSNTESLNNKLIEDYVINQKAIERRLNEQQEIGLVASDGAQVRLTKGGERLVWLMRWIKKIYGINR